MVDVDWGSVVEVSRPEEGSSALIATMSNGSKVIIKGSMNVAAEMFGSMFAARAGVYVPRSRLVLWPHAEWHVLKQSIFAAIETDSGLMRNAQHLLNRTVLYVQDFVGDAVPFYCTRSYNVGLESLDQLGRMIALDVVLNNYDRLPCGDVWQNNGNIGNVLVRPATSEMVAIDTMVVPTTRPQMHMDKLRAVRSNPKPYATKIWLFLRNQGFEWSNTQEAELAIENGLRDGLCAAAELGGSLMDLKAFLKKSVTQDWENVWGMSIAALNDTFLTQLGNCLVEGAAQAPVQWEHFYSQWDVSTAVDTSRADANDTFNSIPCEHDLKVCLIQTSCSGKSATEAVSTYQRQHDNATPDVLVFAEGGATADHSLRQLSKALHPLLIVCGSNSRKFKTIDGDTAHTQLCELVYNGDVILQYRKRFLDGVVSYPDPNPPFVDLPGEGLAGGRVRRVAVAICRDMESTVVVDDIIECKPQLLVNPCHICGDTTSSATTTLIATHRWRGALMGAAAKMDYLAKRHGWVHLRADWATTSCGSGSTQILTPTGNVVIGDPTSTTLCARIPPFMASSSPAMQKVFNDVHHVSRSSPFDQVGKRSITRSAAFDAFQVSSMGFIAKNILALWSQVDMIATLTLFDVACMVPLDVNKVLPEAACALPQLASIATTSSNDALVVIDNRGWLHYIPGKRKGKMLSQEGYSGMSIVAAISMDVDGESQLVVVLRGEKRSDVICASVDGDVLAGTRRPLPWHPLHAAQISADEIGVVFTDGALWSVVVPDLCLHEHGAAKCNGFVLHASNSFHEAVESKHDEVNGTQNYVFGDSHSFSLKPELSLLCRISGSQTDNKLLCLDNESGQVCAVLSGDDGGCVALHPTTEHLNISKAGPFCMSGVTTAPAQDYFRVVQMRAHRIHVVEFCDGRYPVPVEQLF